MAAQGSTKTSQLTVVLVTLLAATLGCGKSQVATSDPASNEAPAGGKTPPSANTSPAAWQTVKGNRDGKTFTLQLPPTWKWDEGGLADNTSFTRTFTFKVGASKAFSKESADEHAKQRLEFLQNNYKKQKGKIRDQRIIKVDDQNAAWLVFTLDSDDGSPPIRMLAHCYLRTKGCDIELKGELLDGRPERKESDFAAAQEDFLKIAQSFRLTDVKEVKEDGE
jgi:hypothetical protein